MNYSPGEERRRREERRGEKRSSERIDQRRAGEDIEGTEDLEGTEDIEGTEKWREVEGRPEAKYVCIHHGSNVLNG